MMFFFILDWVAGMLPRSTFLKIMILSRCSRHSENTSGWQSTINTKIIIDYRLSLAILNKSYYMTNDCLLLLENESPFSPIAVLHYSFYDNREDWFPTGENANLQCIVGRHYLPFGNSQQPKLTDYADGS